MKGKIRRYTSLPVLLDLLTHQRITLVSPMLWEDKNDIFLLDRYADIYDFAFVGAVCLTQANETFHHWKIFGGGNSGVCIEFHTEELQRYILPHANVRMELVKYLRVDGISNNEIYPIDCLPFYKRLGFSAEEEVRIICSNQDDIDCYHIPIDLSSIVRVVASPFLPDALLDGVRRTIHSIANCASVRVDKSRLIESKTWTRKWKSRLRTVP